MRRVRVGDRAATLLGECFTSTDDVRRALIGDGSISAVADRLASLPGSYCVIVDLGEEHAVATDLAGLHRVWFQQSSERVEYASSPLALTGVTSSRLDPESLASRLFCRDFHAGLPGGSLFSGAEEVPPDRVLVMRHGSAALVPRSATPPRSTIEDGGRLLREALDIGVRARVVSAESVTSDFSGGMDSSSLALLAERHRDDPIPALTYADPFAANDDDTGYAARLATRERGTAQVVIEGSADTLPFTDMESVPFTDHPSLDTVIFARDRARLEPASGASVHLAGDGGDVVLGAPLTYLASLARLGGLRRFVHETRGWARLRHRPVHRVMRAAWSTRRTTYADTLREMAGNLAADPTHRGAGPMPRIERNIVWSRLGGAAHWGTREARMAVADRLLQASQGGHSSDGADGHALREIRAHTADTRLFVSIAEQLGVIVALPFFDNQVLLACLAVPADERASVMHVKPLLRAALSDVLPKELHERRTKGDYGACEYQGVRRNGAALRALLDESRLGALGILRPKLVRAELERAVGGEYASMGALVEVFAAEVWLRKLERGRAGAPSDEAPLSLEEAR